MIFWTETVRHTIFRQRREGLSTASGARPRSEKDTRGRIIAVNSNCYHGYSIEQAIDGIAAAGFRYIELLPQGLDGHVPRPEPSGCGR